MPSDTLARLAEALRLTEEQYTGWAVAEEFSATSVELRDENLRAMALRIATRAVLRRAHDLVGPIQPARHLVRETLREPFRGELDDEATMENLIGKEFPEPDDWISARREERRTELVLMMDASLSMSGKNLALAAVAAAVLAFSIKSEDLALIAFESTARTLKSLGGRETAARVVEQLLTQPARGFTNIEDALRTGRRELARGATPRRVGLLITDGVFTAGNDPLAEAALFPRLYVLLTEDYVMDEDLCARMARAGRGRLVRVRGYEDLPASMLRVVSELLR